VRTLLFLTDSDPVELPFALVADKDSEEDSGRGSERGGDENKGCGNKGEESGSEEGDAMVE
jgi:hypothetical protein